MRYGGHDPLRVTPNDGAHLNALLTEAAATVGVDGDVTTSVVLPGGTLETDEQIVVPNKVALYGQGRSGTRIKAGAGFPADTALVRLGAAGAAEVFGCRTEDLTVDCNGVSGATAVYSDSINEQSGVFRCVLRGVKYGLHVENTASGNPQQYGAADVEVYFDNPTATSVGVLHDAPDTAAFERITVVGSLTTPTIESCLHVRRGQVAASSIHCEGATYGVRLGEAGATSASGSLLQHITGPSTNASLTTLVRVENDTQGWTLIAATKGQATNVLDDQVMGNLLTDFVLGFYSAGAGALATRPLLETSQNI